MNDTCEHMRRCGRIYNVKLDVAAAAAELRVLRNDQPRKGRRLCRDAEAGDFVAVEVDEAHLPWFIGEIVDGKIVEYDGDDTTGHTGELSAGDDLVRVRRWLPISTGGGCNIFERVEGAEGDEHEPVVLVHCAAVRHLIAQADANTNKLFASVKRNEHLRRAAVWRIVEGTRISYNFHDKPQAWYDGVVKGLNANGTADVLFDDGEKFHNLDVSPPKGNNQVKILSGAKQVVPPSQDSAPHRTLDKDEKKEIAAQILPPA